jgi:Peptidase A4 family
MTRLSFPVLLAALCLCAIGLSAWQPSPPAPSSAAPLRHAPVRILRNPDATPARGRRNEMLSENWSGYVAARFMTGELYRSAQMTWIVPAISYGESNDSTRSAEFSDEWVGIGGFCEDALCSREDATLIQLGTTEVVSPSGGTVYYAWFERLPEYERAIALKVRPGDAVTATLSCGDSCRRSEQVWTLTMQVGARSWHKRVPYRSRKLSAEWIEEAPTRRSILPLADFATAEFDAISGANGQTPSLSVSENGLAMKDPWGQTSDLSAPTSLGQFATCWGFESFANCPAP